MWIILRANAMNSFCHPSGLKLNPHSANRKLRAGLMPARFFVRIPKVHARAEMHHERAYLHYFAGRKGLVALPSRKVPRFLGSWKENKAFSLSAGMLRPYKGSITNIKQFSQRFSIEYNDVCKSEKEIDKPLGAPVK